MRFLDELEREIERVAVAAPRRRRFGLGLLVLLPLCVGTVALAATSGWLTGAPVKEPGHLNPKTFFGVASGASKLFALRVADPDGGPPWAVRLVHTTRGYGCVQAGRFVDGRIGVLGRDGSFGDDGKFHEIGTNATNAINCQQPDGAGHVFIAMSFVGLPESGDLNGCISHGHHECPTGSLRVLHYGLLGPQATAITYVDNGRVLRQPISGHDGAYLIVQRAGGTNNNAAIATAAVPKSGLRTIEYRDGTVCHVSRKQPCPLKGFVAPSLPVVTAAQVAAPVRVTLGKPLRRPSSSSKIPPQRRVRIRFRARIAADARSFYTAKLELSHGREGCGWSEYGPIARDLKPGDIVNYTLYVSTACHGATATVRIGYAQQRMPSDTPFFLKDKDSIEVGTTAVKLP